MHQEYPKWIYPNGDASKGVIVHSAEQEAAHAVSRETVAEPAAPAPESVAQPPAEQAAEPKAAPAPKAAAKKSARKSKAK